MDLEDVGARGNRSWLYSIVVLFLVSLSLAFGNFVYTNHVDNSSNQQWCSLVSTLDDAYKQNPPQTATGQKVALEIYNLRVNFGCP